MAYTNNLLVPDDGTDLGFARVTSTAEYGLGETRFDKAGNKFRYVEFKDSVTYVAGHVTTPANTALTAVTNDVSGGSSVAPSAFAGVVMGVPTTTLKYGWVQIGGVATTVGGGSVTANSHVKVNSTDGQAVNSGLTAAEGPLCFGVALEDDTGSPALFKCLLYGR